LANVYIKQNNHQEAVNHLRECIRLRPNEAFFDTALVGEYRREANNLYTAGDYEGAIRKASEAIQHDSTNALTYDLRGKSHAKRNEWQAALADYDQAIQRNPTLAYFYSARGDAR